MWLYVYEEVRQGKKIASALAHCKLMPNSVVQMIRSGEDSGNMADVLRDISAFYGRELKAVIKAVTSMIEPIMIVCMGCLVGFIAMSIILPIFKMSSLVSGKWIRQASGGVNQKWLTTTCTTADFTLIEVLIATILVGIVHRGPGRRQRHVHHGQRRGRRPVHGRVPGRADPGVDGHAAGGGS